MPFFEKIMKAAIDLNITNVNQLANATGIPYNALRSCKEKDKPLSDNHKRLLARTLKCSIGDINRMMSEARAEELKERCPHKTKKAAVKDEPVHILEEKIIGEQNPVEPVVEPDPLSEPESELEAVPVEQETVLVEPAAAPVEPAPMVEKAPEPSEGDTPDAKLAADEDLTCYDRIKEAAETTLAEQYTAMLRAKMLEVAMADLTNLCREFLANQDAHKAMAFVDIALEIVNLKEVETK